MSVGGKLIAVANMKGGVGKTTTVVMLAEALAADGARVLVVDLDPQASVSVCLAGDALLSQMITRGRTLEAYLALKLITRHKPDLSARIQSGVSLTVHKNAPLSLSLLPSGPHLRLVEREILYELTERKFSMHAIDERLWKIFHEDFAPLAAAYDYVFFDCAPGISPMTEVAVRAADLVLVASIPDFLSTYGLNAFVETIWRRSGRQANHIKPKSAPYVVVTRFQAQVRQHQQTLARLQAEARAEDAGFHLLETRIPQAAALAEALVPTDGALPTFSAKYGAHVPNVLIPLVAEVKEILHGP
ncbi:MULTISPECIES: ParA family protein [Methylorubrum]|jgi:cellulose biosynthesis protein BcsQ|uniref:Cobyrinic acid ac-diamide synthase n=1 Tax=Methylorubrum populi (strain ATCC BAA-705 / NCIMB 13946 / BJ001) TaxID=441620 RepID=B1ZAU1_METPB|nr:AAA family ATPase [Methylorubrum populi]ACB83414.1 Cobyrinic acid ac-diamide synthase [Methylorubrum populi BJ001]PZP65795.1 MAG: chromosome partitioning protein [Methylorubrum populi]